MNKKLILVGMKDADIANRFMLETFWHLSYNRHIHTWRKVNEKFHFETPHTEVRFIYDRRLQCCDGLRADVVFGLPEYAANLHPYLKPDAPKWVNMGLVDWIVEHERSCEAYDAYCRQDVSTTALAAVTMRATEVLSKIVNTYPEIKNVHFSGPVTCVIWDDGTKTLVRCENEEFDYEKGLAMAIAKKMLGTNKSGSNYYDVFKKYIPKEEKPEPVTINVEPILNAGEAAKGAAKLLSDMAAALNKNRGRMV